MTEYLTTVRYREYKYKKETNKIWKKIFLQDVEDKHRRSNIHTIRMERQKTKQW